MDLVFEFYNQYRYGRHRQGTSPQMQFHIVKTDFQNLWEESVIDQFPHLDDLVRHMISHHKILKETNIVAKAKLALVLMVVPLLKLNWKHSASISTNFCTVELKDDGAPSFILQLLT